MQFNEEIILKGLNLANFELKTHQLIDSTNDECKRISSNKDILVVTADKQTKGKGRKGKKWHSPEGNISLSIAFADREFDVPISIATGILVKDALTEVFNLDSIKLKWPNDLVFDKKKIGDRQDFFPPSGTSIDSSCNLLLERPVSASTATGPPSRPAPRRRTPPAGRSRAPASPPPTAPAAARTAST